MSGSQGLLLEGGLLPLWSDQAESLEEVAYMTMLPKDNPLATPDQEPATMETCQSMSMADLGPALVDPAAIDPALSPWPHMEGAAAGSLPSPDSAHGQHLEGESSRKAFCASRSALPRTGGDMIRRRAGVMPDRPEQAGCGDKDQDTLTDNHCVGVYIAAHEQPAAAEGADATEDEWSYAVKVWPAIENSSCKCAACKRAFFSPLSHCLEVESGVAVWRGPGWLSHLAEAGLPLLALPLALLGTAGTAGAAGTGGGLAPSSRGSCGCWPALQVRPAASRSALAVARLPPKRAAYLTSTHVHVPHCEPRFSGCHRLTFARGHPLGDTRVAQHTAALAEALRYKNVAFALRLERSPQGGLHRLYTLAPRLRDHNRSRLDFLFAFSPNRPFNRALKDYHHTMSVVSFYEPKGLQQADVLYPSSISDGAHQNSPPASTTTSRRGPGALQSGRFSPLQDMHDLEAYNDEPTLLDPSSPPPSIPFLGPPTPEDALPTPPSMPKSRTGSSGSPVPSRMKPIPKPDREVMKSRDGKYRCTTAGCSDEIREFSRKCEWR